MAQKGRQPPMKGQFWTYLIKRVGLGLFTLFVILLASYALMRLAPGDPSKSTFPHLRQTATCTASASTAPPTAAIRHAMSIRLI